MMTTHLLSLEINVHLMGTPTQTHDVRRTYIPYDDQDDEDAMAFGALRYSELVVLCCELRFTI
jgi:hypothetical protein